MSNIYVQNYDHGVFYAKLKYILKFIHDFVGAFEIRPFMSTRCFLKD